MKPLRIPTVLLILACWLAVSGAAGRFPPTPTPEAGYPEPEATLTETGEDVYPGASEVYPAAATANAGGRHDGDHALGRDLRAYGHERSVFLGLIPCPAWCIDADPDDGRAP